MQVTVASMAVLFLRIGTPPLSRMHCAGLKAAADADAVVTSSAYLFEEAHVGPMVTRSVAISEVIAAQFEASAPVRFNAL